LNLLERAERPAKKSVAVIAKKTAPSRSCDARATSVAIASGAAAQALLQSRDKEKVAR
jgi:hypothetical protein